MSDKKFLSQRIRPDSEAAPWVVEEIKKIEQENEKLKEELALMKKAFEISYSMLGDKP